MKIYMTFGGVHYFNYDVFTKDMRFRRYVDSIVLFDEDLYGKLTNLDNAGDLYGRFQTNINPPKGSTIYMMPNCPYSIDDVRKNYKIKRTPDGGDYNVFNPINKLKCSVEECLAIAIVPSRKAVIMSGECIRDLDSFIRYHVFAFCPGISEEDIIVKNYQPYNGHVFYIYDNVGLGVVKDILDGNLTKPVITYKQLNVNSDNELTLDTLNILMRLASVSQTEKDAKTNFLNQLYLINQCNWREYRATIGLVMYQLQKRYGKWTASGQVLATPSRYGKSVQEMIRQQICDPVSEKDMLMGQQIINEILKLGDVKFPPFSKLASKISVNYLHSSIIERFYNVITKITPKEFKNEEERDKVCTE